MEKHFVTDGEVRDVTSKGDRNWNNAKRAAIIGLPILLILAASFVAGRFLGDQFLHAELGNEDVVLSSEDGQAMGMAVQLKPAASLPEEGPVVSGQLHHREDNSLFISKFPKTTGVIYLDSVDEWAIVEVVLTKETRVFKDVTNLSVSHGGGSVQQEVTKGSVEEIDNSQTLFVWGELRGERLVADVLVYFTN